VAEAVAAGAAAAGFAGTVAGGEAGFSVEVFPSDCTDPDVVAFTPPATAGSAADGFGSPSGDDDEGVLVSSGITANAQTYGYEGEKKNVNFYQLEDTVSTSLPRKNG
jgi:hypothetical protein